MVTPCNCGGYLKKFEADVTTEEYNNSGYLVDPRFMNADGGGDIKGVSLTTALAYKYKCFKIIPYITYIKDLNSLMIDETHLHIPMINNSGSGKDNPPAITPGFCFSYVSESALSFSLSISGLLFSRTNYYNDMFLMGLESRNYMLSVSYKIK